MKKILKFLPAILFIILIIAVVTHETADMSLSDLFPFKGVGLFVVIVGLLWWVGLPILIIKIFGKKK